MAGLIDGLTYKDLTSRCLTEESCKKWGYGVSEAHSAQVATYRSPDGTAVVAQKVRKAGKEFFVTGDLDKAGLYGQWLWRDGGKKVVVTEGEIDAISVSQMQEHKWPVVSVPTGSKGAKKALQTHIEWLEKFDEVVLMFDMDEPGQTAAKDCAELFTPGKCKLASLPLKDANELLKAGRGSEIIKAMWDAKVCRPDGVVAGVDLWDRILSSPKDDYLPYPWIGLNDKLIGARKGQIITVCAGSGVGKSEVVGQITHHWVTKHGETCGVIYLEEQLVETAKRFMSIELGRRLLVDDTGVTPADLRRAYDSTVGSGRMFFYDHFGTTDSDSLFSKIRYMVKGCGCSTIILDHISIIVSGMEDGDERRLIDNLMTRLASMVQELNCRLVVICHLRKPQGTSHEEGGSVTLDDLRGSGSLKQLSFDVIGLERNQQDEEDANTTTVRSLKCRRTGRTGIACRLEYDPKSGLLSEKTVFDQPTKEVNSDF